MLGIYVHLPFCPYICPYCDFAKWPHKKSLAKRYLEALTLEIERSRPEPAATLFLGGGTPNTYEPLQLAALIARIKEKFCIARAAEISIEVNPDLQLCTDFEAYRDAGVSRLSIGVQSFHSAEIATLGRRHSAADVVTVVERARRAGIAAVSMDLMFAIPGQTHQSWLLSMQRAIELNVDHISTYGLTVEKGTPYFEWRAREPQTFSDDGHEAELYSLAMETLEQAGYRQYEISNFAKPGFECLHNANYWQNGEYVGLGVGAASFRSGRRCSHTRSLERYMQAVFDDVPVPGEWEELRGAARVGEAVMLALRTNAGVSFERFEQQYNVKFLHYYAAVVQDLRNAGLLAIDDAHAKLTKRGRFFANDVCGEFVTFE
ncbi:MAG: radical SAM family heme chaperone HemW [Candidatus Eremiobacteraeota bacterium]|nr:radical SAM family heme chaperone HemW [Candidatus Eremiobacteraeota bacterium]